jgi:Ribbon-helix-helix protein, copG family
MYMHRVVRTQLYLDEVMHARLRSLARQQGRTVSELVREALVRAYGTTDAQARQAVVMAVLGLWKGRDDIGEPREYVRRLRRGTRRKRRHEL